jgi:hypothetical protein
VEVVEETEGAERGGVEEEGGGGWCDRGVWRRVCAVDSVLGHCARIFVATRFGLARGCVASVFGPEYAC